MDFLYKGKLFFLAPTYPWQYNHIFTYARAKHLLKQLFYFIFNSTCFFSGLLNSFDEPKVNDCQTNMKENQNILQRNYIVFLLVKGPSVTSQTLGSNNDYLEHLSL